jgi:hypothetical protein
MHSATTTSHFVELYERRMRRFNLTVLLVAAVASALASLVTIQELFLPELPIFCLNFLGGVHGQRYWAG